MTAPPLRSHHAPAGAHQTPRTAGRRYTDIVLLGAGNIGRELLARLDAMSTRRSAAGRVGASAPRLRVVAVADRSGYILAPHGLSSDAVARLVRGKAGGRAIASLEGAVAATPDTLIDAVVAAGIARPVLVDATAADTGALLLRALERSWDAVLANKIPLAGDRARYDRIQRVARLHGARVLHEATVGAGLPVIDTLRKLLDAGDEIASIEGCPSGTLGFLFGELARGVRFSEALRQAVDLGLTEPDPRVDLAGIDVARKALILARHIGYQGSLDSIAVESLVPPALASCPTAEFLARAAEHDDTWAARVASARDDGTTLRYRIRVTPSSVAVGLVAVAADDRLGALRGTDNQFSFTTARYSPQPLVISGPGAGAAVTVNGVVNDLLQVARARRAVHGSRQGNAAPVASYSPPPRRVSYEISGPPDAPLVVVLGGISSTHHVVATADDPSPGWWEGVVGRGRAVDTTRYRVLGVDFLDGGRTSSGRPARPVTTHDQADAIAALLDDLGVARAHAFVGASYGGMVSLAFAQRYPERLTRLVAVSAAHESHPMTTGLRGLQRRIVELGLDTGRPFDALALARGVAMTTYRTAREFGERFFHSAERGPGVPFEVERYLERSGRRFASTFPPERFLALSLSADLHRVTPSAIRARATFIAAEGDTLVPETAIRALASRVAGPSRFELVPTRYGHDAFLTEPALVGRIITEALA